MLYSLVLVAFGRILVVWACFWLVLIGFGLAFDKCWVGFGWFWQVLNWTWHVLVDFETGFVRFWLVLDQNIDRFWLGLELVLYRVGWFWSGFGWFGAGCCRLCLVLAPTMVLLCFPMVFPGHPVWFA